MSRYLDGLEAGAKIKFGNLEDKLESITLDADELGVWLVQETEEGSMQMGHISWKQITKGVQQALLQEKFLIALAKIDEEDDLI